MQSQIIRSVGYDSESRLLEVEFNNGWLYEYDDVPAAVHQGLMRADSHGHYLHQNIVDKFVTRRTR